VAEGKQYLWLMLADQMLCGISHSRTLGKTETEKHRAMYYLGEWGRADGIYDTLYVI
jgi:hypothetical protein